METLASTATGREEALLERVSALEAEAEEAREKERDAMRRAAAAERRLRAAEARAKVADDLTGDSAGLPRRYGRGVAASQSRSQLGWPPAGEARLSSPRSQRGARDATRSEGGHGPVAPPPSVAVSAREAAVPKAVEGEGEGEGAHEHGVNASAIVARTEEGDVSMSQDAAAVASMLAQELDRDLRRRQPARGVRARGKRGATAPPRRGADREAVSVAASAAANARADMAALQDRAKRLQESIVSRIGSQESGPPRAPRLAPGSTGRVALSQSAAWPAPAESRHSRRHRRRTWSDDEVLGAQSHRE